jgi:hypothetical protein
MKYEKILNDTWEYLENNYKGSEITIELWIDLIKKESDTENCLKQCIKLLWEQWEWFDSVEERQYFKEYIKNNYGIIVR